MADLVEDLEPLLKEIGEGAPEIVANVRGLTEKLNETAGRLNGIVSDANATRVTSILEELERASRTAASLASDFEQTRAGLDNLLASADSLIDENRSDVRRAVADLRDTLDAFARGADTLSANLETASRNLVEFSDDIRRDPSVLLRGRSEGE
jgi:phospholipid/cholesterol/gamma-HCH transport system substrate-binding protein